MFTRGSGHQGDVAPAVRTAGAQPPRRPDVRRRDVGCDARRRATSAVTPLVAPVSPRRRRRRPRVRAHQRLGTDLSNWPAPALAAVLALVLVVLAWRTGDDDDQHRRFARLPVSRGSSASSAVVALAVDTVRVYRSVAELPTDDGLRRAAKWLGYRARLLARIPDRASVVAPPEQQRALADACVMGVAEHVVEQLSVAAEDDRLAWSDAGGTPHIVRVRYPTRPAYGRQPILVTVDRRGRADGVAGGARDARSGRRWRTARIARRPLPRTRRPRRERRRDPGDTDVHPDRVVDLGDRRRRGRHGLGHRAGRCRRPRQASRRRHPLRPWPAAARRPRPLLDVPRRRRRDAATSSRRGWPTSARQHPRARRRGSAPRRCSGTSARASRSEPPRAGISR